MRTTLTIDDDVAALLREEAQRTRLPFKQVVNRALRLGLRSCAADSREPFQTIGHSFGFCPGIDLDRLNQVADELEASAVRDSLLREP